jgi:mRNA-degrading endonuclease HigB of HigAB toxin-antitoxin module
MYVWGDIISLYSLVWIKQIAPDVKTLCAMQLEKINKVSKSYNIKYIDDSSCICNQNTSKRTSLAHHYKSSKRTNFMDKLKQFIDGDRSKIIDIFDILDIVGYTHLIPHIIYKIGIRVLIKYIVGANYLSKLIEIYNGNQTYTHHDILNELQSLQIFYENIELYQQVVDGKCCREFAKFILQNKIKIDSKWCDILGIDYNIILYSKDINLYRLDGIIFSPEYQNTITKVILMQY